MLPYFAIGNSEAIWIASFRSRASTKTNPPSCSNRHRLPDRRQSLRNDEMTGAAQLLIVGQARFIQGG
jgi:hypothetical protein